MTFISHYIMLFSKVMKTIGFYIRKNELNSPSLATVDLMNMLQAMVRLSGASATKSNQT